MKKILKILALIFVLLSIYFAVKSYPKLDLISGFSAKNLTSAHFIDHRPLELIQKNDNDIPLVNLASNTIDEAGQCSTASVFGFKKRKAIFREGLGATLINDNFDVLKSYEVPKRIIVENDLPFPYGKNEPRETIFSNIDYGKLEKAVKAAFDLKNQKEKRTRSVLVIYKDKIIAEKYESAFNKNSKILGWSMTKSITATLFGILQKQGKLSVSETAPVEEWQKDNRKNITINDLLHMNSGLEWEEKYDKICDATQMLFLAENMAQVQLKKPLLHKPNTHWNYSSGTTNLLSGILRSQFNTHQQYLDFWYAALIDKIGMHSMIVETDMSGNYVGSSYAWATTRDWAKFGLLYLHKGNWNGNQIFDENWVNYVVKPTETSNARYGAHFWLNAGGFFPDLPRDMYYASGFQGQMIAIIPSMDMVIVRMGLKENPAFNFNYFLKSIISSVK